MLGANGGYSTETIPVGDSITVRVADYRPLIVIEETNKGGCAVVFHEYNAGTINTIGSQNMTNTLSFTKPATGSNIIITNLFDRAVDVLYKIV